MALVGSALSVANSIFEEVGVNDVVNLLCVPTHEFVAFAELRAATECAVSAHLEGVHGIHRRGVAAARQRPPCLRSRALLWRKRGAPQWNETLGRDPTVVSSGLVSDAG